MTISYPLTCPTTVKFESFTLRGMDVVASSTSPFSRVQQVYQHSGACWMAEVAWPLLKVNEVAEIIGFLDSLRGTYGYFLMGEPLYTIQGTGAGTPLVNGLHSARATSLATKGWTPASLVLRAGDLFQIGTGSSTRLYRNLTNATADGSGNVTLDIWPPLRATLTGDNPLTTTSPKGIWRLASNERGYDIVRPNKYRVAFAAVEYL